MTERNPKNTPATRRAAMIGLGLGGLGAALFVGRKSWTHFDLGNRLFNPTDVHNFTLPAVTGVTRADGSAMPGFGSKDLVGQPTLLHGFGSWCPDCRAEHPELMRLVSAHNLRLFGLDFLDNDEKAAAYLKAEGNPFYALGADPTGIVTHAFGIRGVPSTVLLDKGGDLVMVVPGPLTEEMVTYRLLPKMAQLG